MDASRREEKSLFWEREGLVERFAARESDIRLSRLLDDYPDPPATRVLDLGTAGGRNAVLLAERGFDLQALDASRAMVARTRERLTPILGASESVRRVVLGDMDDLGRFAAASFDLVVGLGIYHQARSLERWERAISETARVLRPGGRLLYASFAPDSAPSGQPGTPVQGEPHVYSGFRSGVLTLLDEDAVERALERQGLVPEVPTVTVRVETEKGVRVTVNGLFRRRP